MHDRLQWYGLLFCTSPGRCVQCRALADCANGYLACSSNACVCRQKRSANILRNPGFDGNASMWTINGGAYDGNTDADNCPASGSANLSAFGHSMNQCVPASAGVAYQFGFRFIGSSSQCDFAFYSDTSCSTFLDGSDIIIVNSNGSWVSGFDAKTSPAGTQSISVHCATATGTGRYDQFYLAATSGGF